MNRQYLDPALKGAYPTELKEIFGEAWPDWPAQDLADIDQPVDFIGINYYTRNVVRPRRDAMAAEGRHGAAGGQDLHRDRVGSACPPALADLLQVVQGALWRHAALHHRKRRGLLRSAGRGARTGVHDPLRVAYLQAPHRRGRRGDRRRASTCAATCCGRCSTISNGRSAIPSASAWSTSTSSRQKRTPKDSAHAVQPKSSPATAPCSIRGAWLANDGQGNRGLSSTARRLAARRGGA